MTDTTTRRPSSRGVLAAGLVALLVGGLVGAWLDWQLWHPESGIVITFGAAALIVIGVLIWRFGHRVARSIDVLVVAAGIGLLLGQNLGPAREIPAPSSGTMTVRLTRPQAAEATATATCSSTSDAANILASVEGGRGLALVDGWAAFPSVRRGEMWDLASDRDDQLEVEFLMNSTGPLPDDGRPITVFMISDQTSTLTSSIDGRSGSIEFSGLVRNERYETGAAQADPIDMAGTIEFSCEAPSADAG